MAELETLLADLRDHDGVEHVLLVGRDGLLIHQLGGSELDAETLAALAPGLVAAGAALGEAAGNGDLITAALEWENGVGILTAVADEMLLAVLLRPNVGFAGLLRALREQRGRLAEFV